MTTVQEQLTPSQVKLVRRNIHLAYKLASVMWNKNRNHLDRDEAIASAFQGLIAAARNWDPTREDINPEDLENGKAFSGYARHRILGSIRDWQRQQDYVSRNQRRVYKKISEVDPSGELTLSEISDIIDEPEGTIKSSLQAVESSPISLESFGTETEGSLLLSLPSPVDTESTVMIDSVANEVVNKIHRMDDIYQVILVLRYYENMPMYAIARLLGKTTARVGHLHNIAVLELLAVMRNSMNVVV